MFYFYVDESGSRSLNDQVLDEQAPLSRSDFLYVLTAVSLFEHKWHSFEKYLRRCKRKLARQVLGAAVAGLSLRDFEVKSQHIRIARHRRRHPFLGLLSDEQLQHLVDAYYRQLAYHKMNLFAVVVDKRYLRSFMDPTKLQRKAWELLMERVEHFMRVEHRKHQAIIVADDTTRQENLALAEKIVYLQENGTSCNLWLRHISGLPLFTRSELSNGIQLADLCAYNIYRAFRDADLDYPFFRRIESHIWSNAARTAAEVEGLKVFPEESPLVEMKLTWQKKCPGSAEPGHV